MGGALESLIHAIQLHQGGSSEAYDGGAGGPEGVFHPPLPGPYSRTLHLDLRGNGIGDGDVVALVDAVRHLPVFRVDLRHNSLTPGAVQDLAAALGTGPASGTILGVDAVEVEAVPVGEHDDGPQAAGGGMPVGPVVGDVLRIRGVRRGVLRGVTGTVAHPATRPEASGLLDGDSSVTGSGSHGYVTTHMGSPCMVLPALCSTKLVPTPCCLPLPGLPLPFWLIAHTFCNPLVCPSPHAHP